jgi:hypothetical protein
LKKSPESLYGYKDYNKEYIQQTYKSGEKIDVCKNCWSCIDKRKVPDVAAVNGLMSEKVPKDIADLNMIELILIQIIRPIQVIKI